MRNYKLNRDGDKFEVEVARYEAGNGVSINRYEDSEFISVDAKTDSGFSLCHAQIPVSNFTQWLSIGSTNWIKIEDSLEIPEEEVLVCTKSKLLFLAAYNFVTQQWEETTQFSPISDVTHYMIINLPED